MSSSTSDRMDAAYARLFAALEAKPVDLDGVQAALNELEAAGAPGMAALQRWLAEVLPAEWRQRPRVVPPPDDSGGAS